MSTPSTASSVIPTLFLAEPPALYLVRPPLVVDCSALAGIVFQESWQQQAQQSITGHTLHAPNLLPFEITSVAVKKLRQGESHAADGLAQFLDMTIELHEIDVQTVCALALQYQLSAYDASYLWLAAELTCPLATFDQKLATAAQAHLNSLP
jgi:predicted nucleic acid-binding protein